MLKKIQGLIKGIWSKDTARASICYLVASVIGQGVVLLSSGLFTRIMSKSDYGLVNTYATWVLVLNAVICLNVFITVRNAYIDYKEDYDSFVKSISTLIIISGLGFTVLLTVGARLILGANVGIQVLIACCQAVGLNLINLKLAAQAMKGEYRQRSLLMVFPNLIQIILSLILISVFSTHMYYARITTNSAVFLIIGCMIAVKIAVDAPSKINTDYWKYALIISIPSIFHTLSDLLLMQCDRLMLTEMAGAQETAEYSIVYNVGAIVIILYQAINGAWTPWFFKKADALKKEETRKYHDYYMLLFSVITVAILTISPELVKIISPSSYWGSMKYLGVLVVASYFVFLYAFFSTYLMFVKKTKQIAISTVIAAVLNVLMNYYLIPLYGGQGAAIATVASYAILFMIYFVGVGREGRSFFNIPMIWVYIAGIAGYSVIFQLIIDHWYLRYPVLLATVGIIWLLRGRKIVKELKDNKS